MSQLNFYNENQFRAYPFQFPASTPDAAIVEAWFITWPDSGFDPALHTIWLRSITGTGPWVLTFRSDAELLNGQDLSITVAADADENSVHRDDVESSSVQSSSSQVGCLNLPVWEGAVVVGLADQLTANTFTDGECVVEPGRIHAATYQLVASVNLANGDRTRAESAEGCPTPSPDLPSEPPFVAARCLQNHVKFREGYNSTIRMERGSNSIIFGAAVGAGLGEPCEEVPLFPGEEPPVGSSLLSGGPSCGEVISSLNGLQGPILSLMAGSGIVLGSDPENNQITVDLDLSGFAVCGESSSVV